MKNDTLTCDCKKYLGMEPFNDSSNFCKGDYYYLFELYNKYGVQDVVTEIKKLRNYK